MIKGIHHISMKCRPEQMEKVRAFYCGMLGLPVFAEWETGFLLDTPNGKVEFFTNATEDLPKGTIRHFAFEVGICFIKKLDLMETAKKPLICGWKIR